MYDVHWFHGFYLEWVVLLNVIFLDSLVRGNDDNRYESTFTSIANTTKVDLATDPDLKLTRQQLPEQLRGSLDTSHLE